MILFLRHSRNFFYLIINWINRSLLVRQQYKAYFLLTLLKTERIKLILLRQRNYLLHINKMLNMYNSSR